MEINFINIIEAVGLIIGGATILARLTPTQKDDNFIEKIRKFVEKLSNFFLPNVESKDLDYAYYQVPKVYFLVR